MKIERVISIFKKNRENLFMEIKADDLNLSTIKKIFSLKDDDPKLYRPYKVTKKEYDFLVRYKKELESYPVSKFDLYLETYSVKK